MTRREKLVNLPEVVHDRLQKSLNGAVSETVRPHGSMKRKTAGPKQRTAVLFLRDGDMLQSLAEFFLLLTKFFRQPLAEFLEEFRNPVVFIAPDAGVNLQ